MRQKLLRKPAVLTLPPDNPLTDLILALLCTERWGMREAILKATEIQLSFLKR